MRVGELAAYRIEVEQRVLQRRRRSVGMGGLLVFARAARASEV
jgi:hypothetical protein